MTTSRESTGPNVSFVMAAYNAAPFIAAAIQSALDQVGPAVEVIVVDDGSTDATPTIVADLVARDSRIKLARNRVSMGPAGARNRAISMATGAWIAILDADDLIDPNRTQALLGMAQETGCEIVADNVARFLSTAPEQRTIMLAQNNMRPRLFLTTDSYLRGNRMTGGAKNYGYLKPMFLRSFVRSRDIRYDETLRIGEDFDFCLKALLAGGRMVVTTQALYRYRMLSTSISRRLSLADVEAMRIAYDRLATTDGSRSLNKSADRSYRRSLAEMCAYLRFREGLSKRKLAQSALRAADPVLWAAIASLALTRARRYWPRPI